MACYFSSRTEMEPGKNQFCTNSPTAMTEAILKLDSLPGPPEMDMELPPLAGVSPRPIATWTEDAEPFIRWGAMESSRLCIALLAAQTANIRFLHCSQAQRLALRDDRVRGQYRLPV